MTNKVVEKLSPHFPVHDLTWRSAGKRQKVTVASLKNLFSEIIYAGSRAAADPGGSS